MTSHPDHSTTDVTEADAPQTDFGRDVLAGLARRPRSIPAKYFYDERGSRLFDEITRLDAYYPTRTERQILLDHADELVALLPPKKRGRYQALTRPVDKRRFIVQSLHQGHLLQQLPKPSVQEIEKLVASLSPEARAAVAKLDNPQARTELVQKWLRSAVTARMNQNRAFQLAPAVDTRVLDKFFDEKL